MVVGHPQDSYPYRTTVGIQVEKVWTLEQIFGTFYVYVPIRATILKAGGLSWVGWFFNTGRWWNCVV